MLSPNEKAKIITQHKRAGSDTGSAEIQVAIFTEEIKRLTRHLKEHPKDHSSRRGLLKMVAKRKRLLEFLGDKSIRRHNKLVRVLKL